ncbi:MAG: hypothetical protein JWL80_548 [Parcubacteria group bacterium]|nr:hypothetical protein [Parcubacteria group bacterium]
MTETASLPTAAFIAFHPLRVDGRMVMAPKVFEEPKSRVYVYPATFMIEMDENIVYNLQRDERSGSIAFTHLTHVVVLVDVRTATIMRHLEAAQVPGEITTYLCSDYEIVDMIEEISRSHPGAKVLEVSQGTSPFWAFQDMIEKFRSDGTL